MLSSSWDAVFVASSPLVYPVHRRIDAPARWEPEPHHPRSRRCAIRGGGLSTRAEARTDHVRLHGLPPPRRIAYGPALENPIARPPEMHASLPAGGGRRERSWRGRGRLRPIRDHARRARGDRRRADPARGVEVL